MVHLNKEEWKKSTCSCKYFSKKYFCAHVIVVAVAIKLIKIPNHCKNVNIGILNLSIGRFLFLN